MARKPKVIEVPGDVAPVEVAAPAPVADVPTTDGDYIEIGGVKRLIIERTAGGWVKVQGVGQMRIEG